LHDTLVQRQKPTYASDSFLRVDIEVLDHKLVAGFVEDTPLILNQSEIKPLHLWCSNTGTRAVKELWAVVKGPQSVLFGSQEGGEEGESKVLVVFWNSFMTVRLGASNLINSQNSLNPLEPIKLPLKTSNNQQILSPGDSIELPVLLQVNHLGPQEVKILLLYREVGGV
jgi:trafficking protein particle complex subunit 8